jgi:DNA-binding CsgD family transcriptional regulator/tetratricopeptide (TPR) repeat protein
MLHLRAGRALEQASPRPVARLARHFREAGDTGRWCRYAEQAAEEALASGDEATALALLHDLVTGARLPAAAMARLTRKIPFPSLTGDDRYQDLVRALRAALNVGPLEPGEEAAVRFTLGLVLETMEDYEAGRAELEKAIPHMTDDPVDAAWAMMFLGYPHGTTCPASMHLQWLRRADLLNAPMAAAERLRFTVDKASALLMLGEEEGWAEAAAIPADAPTAQARWQVTRGNLNMGELAMMWGRYAEARRRLTRALNLAEDHQYLRYRYGILVLQAHLDWFTGSWEGLAERAASVAGRDDIQPQTRMDAVLVSGLLNAAAGDHSRAAADLELVLAEKLKRGAVDRCAEPAAALASLRLCAGAVDEALRITDAPVGMVAGKGIWVLAADLAPVRVSALIAAGRTGEATDLVAAFADALRGRNVPAPRAALLACRARLAEARGEQLRAAAMFARAAAAWQALPRPYDALLARERQARCLLAARQAEAAMAVLQDVHRGLHRLGATGDANRAMRTLREHGVDARRPGPGRPGYGDKLSPRELEVVRLLAAGHTDREIASALFLSAKTVACHVNSAKRKLRAASRTALAVSAVSAGVVPASGSKAQPAPRPPEFVR